VPVNPAIRLLMMGRSRDGIPDIKVKVNQ